jgi:hypothetical protein
LLVLGLHSKTISRWDREGKLPLPATWLVRPGTSGTPSEPVPIGNSCWQARFAWGWRSAGSAPRQSGGESRRLDRHRLWNLEKQRNPRLACWKGSSKCASQEDFRVGPCRSVQELDE